MIVKKTLSLKAIYEFTGHHIYWLTAWMLLVTSTYYFTHWTIFSIPWLPLSLIGIAVAFYVGFKNSQSYSRLWEARMIWGAIVNNSRKLASLIKNLQSGEPGTDKNEAVRKQIIFRHIAWLYQLREQLLEPAPWEHVSLKGLSGNYNRKRRKAYFSYYRTELDELGDRAYLSAEEAAGLQRYNNKAAQLLDRQTGQVQSLYESRAINMLQQIKIQDVIDNLYDEQGKAERIKRFPFPRKYASFSFVFVCIFIFLLPFGIVNEFKKLGDELIWLSVPVGVIVGWIYVVMELIGDYSENPFQGLHNDIPMLSISRAIEIDMLQMIGEGNIPEPIKQKGDILI